MTTIDVAINQILGLTQQKNPSAEVIQELHNILVGTLRVYEVEPTAVHINVAFGLTDERMEELLKVAYDKYESFEKTGVVKWSEILVELSKHVSSSTELLLVGFEMGIKVEEIRAMQEGNPITALLRAMGKGVL